MGRQLFFAWNLNSGEFNSPSFLPTRHLPIKPKKKTARAYKLRKIVLFLLLLLLLLQLLVLLLVMLCSSCNSFALWGNIISCCMSRLVGSMMMIIIIVIVIVLVVVVVVVVVVFVVLVVIVVVVIVVIIVVNVVAGCSQLAAGCWLLANLDVRSLLKSFSKSPNYYVFRGRDGIPQIGDLINSNTS